MLLGFCLPQNGSVAGPKALIAVARSRGDRLRQPVGERAAALAARPAHPVPRLARRAPPGAGEDPTRSARNPHLRRRAHASRPARHQRDQPAFPQPARPRPAVRHARRALWRPGVRRSRQRMVCRRVRGRRGAGARPRETHRRSPGDPEGGVDHRPGRVSGEALPHRAGPLSSPSLCRSPTRRFISPPSHRLRCAASPWSPTAGTRRDPGRRRCTRCSSRSGTLPRRPDVIREGSS